MKKKQIWKISFRQNNGGKRRSVIREQGIYSLFAPGFSRMEPSNGAKKKTKRETQRRRGGKKRKLLLATEVERLRNALFPCHSFYEDVTCAYLPPLFFFFLSRAVSFCWLFFLITCHLGLIKSQVSVRLEKYPRVWDTSSSIESCDRYHTYNFRIRFFFSYLLYWKSKWDYYFFHLVLTLKSL